jgi:hypothetical protein
MSKRYIRFGTMKRVLRIPDKVSFRDLLEVLCEAEEFEDVRLRADEKTGYKEMGRSDRMRFPVKEVKVTKDKVLVIIQMVCGGHALADIKVDSQPVMQSLSVLCAPSASGRMMDRAELAFAPMQPSRSAHRADDSRRRAPQSRPSLVPGQPQA